MSKSADQRKYRTGELDLLYAEMPVWIVIGPIAPTDQADMANAFDAIARGGPKNRVGLLTSRSERHWRFVARPGSTAVRSACPVVCRNAEEALVTAMTVRPDAPLAAWRCGEYLCLFYDHGLGDGRFIQRVLATLSDPAAVASFDAPGTTYTRHPFAVALWAGLRREPGQLVRDLLHMGSSLDAWLRGHAQAAVSRRARTTAGQPPAVAQAAEDEPTTACFSSAPTYLEELRRHRDAHHPGVSTTALVMYSICKSMASLGANLSGNIEILSDLRRFLPEGSETLANFVATVAVPFSARTTPEDFGAALTREVTSYRSVLKLIAVQMVSTLRPSLWRPRRTCGDWVAASDDRSTQVTITDFTRFPADAQIRWSDSSRSEVAVSTPPYSRRHLVIVLCSSGDNRLQLTVRFHESHIDRPAVRRMIEHALSPARFRILDDASLLEPSERAAN